MQLLPLILNWKSADKALVYMKIFILFVLFIWFGACFKISILFCYLAYIYIIQGSRLTFCTGCTGAPNFFS